MLLQKFILFIFIILTSTLMLNASINNTPTKSKHLLSRTVDLISRDDNGEDPENHHHHAQPVATPKIPKSHQ
jgi:hypothetical protein